MLQKIKVGIPKGLLYHKYFIKRKVFFEELDCEVITSIDTNKSIIQEGSKLTIDESCLSIKIFLGHIKNLVGKVDYILIPRIVSLEKSEELCVKFFGLYDIVKNSFDDIKILDYCIDEKTGIKESKEFVKMGLKIENNLLKVMSAYNKANFAYKKYIASKKFNVDKNKINILLVGHSYTLHDEFLVKPIDEFLKKKGVNVIYSDSLDPILLKKNNKISDKIFWTYNKEMYGAMSMLKDQVQGMIFLVTFPCGPDSIAMDLAYRKLKDDVPIINIVLDELQADIGLVTRLESFLDVLEIKLKKGKK